MQILVNGERHVPFFSPLNDQIKIFLYKQGQEVEEEEEWDQEVTRGKSVRMKKGLTIKRVEQDRRKRKKEKKNCKMEKKERLKKRIRM